MVKKPRSNLVGTVRELPADDPDSIDHPSHKAQWLELARAMGRMDAKRDFEILSGTKVRKDEETED